MEATNFAYKVTETLCEINDDGEPEEFFSRDTWYQNGEVVTDPEIIAKLEAAAAPQGF